MKKIDLTKGRVLSVLTTLALPIMGNKTVTINLNKTIQICIEV